MTSSYVHLFHFHFNAPHEEAFSEMQTSRVQHLRTARFFASTSKPLFLAFTTFFSNIKCSFQNPNPRHVVSHASKFQRPNIPLTAAATYWDGDGDDFGGVDRVSKSRFASAYVVPIPIPAPIPTIADRIPAPPTDHVTIFKGTAGRSR